MSAGSWVYVLSKPKEDCGPRRLDGEYLLPLEQCDAEVGTFLLLNGPVRVASLSGWLLEFLRAISSCDCNLHTSAFSDEACED